MHFRKNILTEFQHSAQHWQSESEDNHHKRNYIIFFILCSKFGEKEGQ